MKKVLSVLTLLVMVCTMLVPAFAVGSEHANGYNVIIAMDASGSLKETDPNNYRLNAVNLFIHLLSNDNNKLGCLSFSTYTLGQSKLNSITQTGDKEAIYDTLKTTAEREVPKNGWTNIGSALESAIKDINANGDKNLQSVILLLSDGNTELPSDKETQASLDMKADAVQAARDNHIAIYSVCLNANGKADKKEMEQLSKATGGKSIEITRAEDLQDALTTFYSMIYGTSVKNIVDNTFDSKGLITVPFDVPGTGVEEINIIIYGKAKDIVISKPDNSPAKSDEVVAETFSFLKVSDIVPGQWNVSLSGVPGDKVKVDLLFNTDLSVVTNISPDKDRFNPEDAITIEAILNSDSGPSSSNAVSGYTATLKLRDNYGDIIEEIPMNPVKGSFLVETKLAEGIYKYSVAVAGYNINKESEIKGPIRVSTDVASKEQEENTPPIPVEDPYEIKLNLWPFKDNSYTLNVSGLATDNQDEPLEYRIDTSSFIEGEDYTFDGKSLNMIDFSLSKGEFIINAYDKFGESCQITVHVTTRNIGLITVVVLAVVALIVIALILFVIFRNKILFFNGSLTVTSQQTWQTFVEEYPGKGQYKLYKFTGLDDIGLNYHKSYFQATGGKHIFLCTDKPIVQGGTKATKKLRMETGIQYCVSLPMKNGEVQPSIIVQFDSRKKK